jgi:putative membrane protein
MLYYDHDFGWWGYAGMGIAMVLFLALLGAGIVALLMLLSDDQHARRTPPAEIPEKLLAARFARGEITELEYRDRLAVLHDSAGR